MVETSTLARLELFEGLPEEALQAMARMSQEMSFRAHSSLFSPEQSSKLIYLLLEGSVALTVFAPPLSQPVTMAVLKTPGQAFGFAPVIGQGHHNSSAEALTDVRVIAVDGGALMEYFAKEPGVGFTVMTRVAHVISRRLGTLRKLLLETVIEYERQSGATEEN